MSENQTQKSNLRNYLLGNVTSIDEKFEERLMTDDKFFQELEIEEEELIQDYVDENLNDVEKQKFETHFLISKERQEKVYFAQSLRVHIDKKESEESKATSFKPTKTEKRSFFSSFFSSPIPVAICLLIIAGLSAVLIWNNFLSPSENEIALASLNKAFKNERPLESRISGFDYAPKSNTRGNDSSKVNKLELERAKQLIQKNAIEDLSVTNLHALGKLYLAENEFDDAIETFEKATKINPTLATLHNDLGSAFLEKGQITKDEELRFFAMANEEFKKTLDIDNSLLEAHFNLAIVAEALSMNEEAKAAWKKYLELDSTSMWAGEARSHLEKLEKSKSISRTNEEILEDFLKAKESENSNTAWQILSSNREKITDKLIPQQLTFAIVDTKIENDEIKAKKYLDALIYLGKLEEEKSGDKFWSDMATYYANVSDDKLSILKKAQDFLKKGNLVCLEGKYKESLNLFETAKFFFLEADNEFDAILTETMTAYCKIRLGKIKDGNIELNKHIVLAEKKNYKWLNTQALLWLGINANSTKQFSNSIKYFKNALKFAEETNDLYAKGQILSSLSNTYFLLGQYDKSLSFTEKNLELAKSPDVSLRQKWRDIYAAGNLFYQMEFYHTALLFEFEGLSLAQTQLNEKTFDYSNFINIGLIYGKMNKLDKAYSFIKKGESVARKFTDQQLKRKCFAYTNLKLGHLRRQEKDYAQSTDNYKKAIEFYDSDEFQVNGYEAHKGLLLNYFAENNDVDFQKELPKIINIFNEYRNEINEEQNRNSFFDIEQSVYDIAIDYEFRKLNFEKSFNYAEESRSRSLLDLQNSALKVSNSDSNSDIKVSSEISVPLKLSQIQEEMPENTQLIEFAVLSDKVIIWAITKNSFDSRKSEISGNVLQQIVISYLEAISENKKTNEEIELSKKLFQLLIAPIKEQLDSEKDIFIIPDKVLFRLPFATLLGEGEKYLIEEYKISYSPSSNVFLNSSKRAEELKKDKFEDLLIIGNPSFNIANYENELRTLPSAKEEAIEIAQEYNDPIVLTEKNATKEMVKENLVDADVIHFAGHYLVDKKSTLNSSLILAGENKENSELNNSEIFNLKLSNTRLIILSACQTGVENYYNGEGMIGASRTFLAKGIPLVVASQWAVDSDATKELMVSFHKFRTKEKTSTSESLRLTQLEMLGNKKYSRPYYWAAFATIGGYAEF